MEIRLMADELLRPALSIQRITVKNDRVVCLVHVSEQVSPYTFPSLMERVLRVFPRVAQHTCVNSKGPFFASVMEKTSLPHLLEHLVIELQARALQNDLRSFGSVRLPDDFVFVGSTEWVDRSALIARVSVNFADDLIALRAFFEASDFINRKVIS